MKPKLKIEKGVPLPTRFKSEVSLHVKDAMPLLEVGDSFFVKYSDFPNSKYHNIATIVMSNAYRLKIKVISKSEPSGVRFWRINQE